MTVHAKGEVRAVSAEVARAAATLALAGVASPRADAELLAGHVLGVSRGRLVLVEGFSPAAYERFTTLVARRASRVPLQHLTGTAGFDRRELAVGPGVFVPRPETELLAQWAKEIPATTVVDLCSGSGALALAIADHRPGAAVHAVERDPAALRWLRRNTASTPVRVVEADATDPATLSELAGTVDLVVCNPPYVPEGLRAAVPPEVADHDPPQAVFAGADGLAVITPVVALAARLLAPGGWLGLEHDESHAAAVMELLRPAFTEITGRLDLAGRPRHVTARRMAD